MTTEILGIIFMYVLTVALAIPWDGTLERCIEGEKTWLDAFSIPLTKCFSNWVALIPKRK